MSWTMTHPLDWPTPARAGLFIGTAAVVFSSGLFLCIGEQREQQRNAIQRQHELQHQFKRAWAETDRLPALRQQQNTLAATLLKLQEQHWSEGTLGQLQQKISRRAQECGLVLATYQPAPRRPDARQAEAVVHLSGSYQGLARFLSLIATPPHALTATELDISPVSHNSSGTALQAKITLAASLSDTPPTDKP